MAESDCPEALGHGHVRFGELVTGRVLAVFRWGVIVELGLGHVGLIDVLYIDDDMTYVVGEEVHAYLDAFDEAKEKYILRPPGQISLADRLASGRYPYGPRRNP